MQECVLDVGRHRSVRGRLLLELLLLRRRLRLLRQLLLRLLVLRRRWLLVLVLVLGLVLVLVLLLVRSLRGLRGCASFAKEEVDDALRGPLVLRASVGPLYSALPAEVVGARGAFNWLRIAVPVALHGALRREHVIASVPLLPEERRSPCGNRRGGRVTMVMLAQVACAASGVDAGCDATRPHVREVGGVAMVAGHRVRDSTRPGGEVGVLLLLLLLLLFLLLVLVLLELLLLLCGPSAGSSKSVVVVLVLELQSLRVLQVVQWVRRVRLLHLVRLVRRHVCEVDRHRVVALVVLRAGHVRAVERVLARVLLLVLLRVLLLLVHAAAEVVEARSADGRAPKEPLHLDPWLLARVVARCAIAR